MNTMKGQSKFLNNSVHIFDYRGYTVQCNYGKYSIVGMGKKTYKSAQAAMAVIDKLDDAENFVSTRKFTK